MLAASAEPGLISSVSLVDWEVAARDDVCTLLDRVAGDLIGQGRQRPQHVAHHAACDVLVVDTVDNSVAVSS